jgi:hypothetical protein
VPSSTPDTRGGSRPPAALPTWFTAAAVERIAACVSSDLPLVESTASRIIRRYLQSDRGLPVFGLENDDFIERETLGRRESIRFYTFAGLVELAVSVGYVELDGWEELAALEEALKDFDKNESLQILFGVDRTLIRDLIARLESGNHRSAKPDVNLFHAFASYLQLTKNVQTDSRCRAFIVATANWKDYAPNGDLSFLSSPHHFGEALASGTVAGVPASALMDGLVALDYFRWFSEILNRMSRDSEIADKFVRHARWSHHMLQVHRRLDVWAARMCEWQELSADAQGEAAEAKEKRLALRPSESELKRLELAGHLSFDFTIGLPEIDRSAFQRDAREESRLFAEGRNGAVKQRLLNALDSLDTVLSRSYTYKKDELPVVEELAMEMVDICQDLASLGGNDTAAVILAKYTDYFASTFGPEHAATKRASAVVAGSRASTQYPSAESQAQENKSRSDIAGVGERRAISDALDETANKGRNYSRGRSAEP